MIRDEEIDLTERRDFSIENRISEFVVRNGRIFSNIGEAINSAFRKKMYGNTIPWNVTPLYRTYKYDGLVALGNSEERTATIESHNWGTINNITCDCCGKEYKKIPWKEDFGICEECDKLMHKRTFPWE